MQAFCFVTFNATFVAKASVKWSRGNEKNWPPLNDIPILNWPWKGICECSEPWRAYSSNNTMIPLNTFMYQVTQNSALFSCVHHSLSTRPTTNKLKFGYWMAYMMKDFPVERPPFHEYKVVHNHVICPFPPACAGQDYSDRLWRAFSYQCRPKYEEYWVLMKLG